MQTMNSMNALFYFCSFKLIPKKTEKFLLRNAFQDLLPKEVLWRSKEGFSEALGKVDLGDVLEEFADSQVGDTQFADRERIFPVQTPQTKVVFYLIISVDHLLVRRSFGIGHFLNKGST